MPRLSYWKNELTSDFYFLDRIIREQFHVGGTSAIVHKYIGPANTDDENEDELTIQDMLLLENRDRKYEKDLYELRGVYNISDNDFDLTQFGLFLTNDILYISFHLNEIVEIIGRKLMNGDVIELPHIIDKYGLDASTPPIPKFYVVQDGNFAGEGFAQSWRPHIWRVKIGPIPDSQEYRDITGDATDEDSIKNIFSTFDKEIDIRNAVVKSAEENDPVGGKALVDHLLNFVDKSERSFFNMDNISSGVSFPANPKIGDFFIRSDFKPYRLFRYSGNKWVRIFDRINDQTWSDNTFNASTFINNDQTDVDSESEYETRQSITKVLKGK